MALALMLQGTGSDVGKSVLLAGMARAFTRRGLKVRPFKPQNMSNNAAERVLDECHFCHQIGGLDQFRTGVSAGDDDVEIVPLGLQCRDDIEERQIVVAQDDVELVEQHQPIGRVSDHRLSRFPRLARGGGVAGAILRIPGEALTHRPAGDEVAEALECQALAGGPHSLDELDDAHWQTVTETAQHHPKGGGRLPLPFSGVDDQQAPLLRLGGQHALARRLAPRHLLVVAPVDLLFGLDEIAHDTLHWARAPRTLLLRGRHSPRSIASAKRRRVSARAAGLCSAIKPRTASSQT